METKRVGPPEGQLVGDDSLFRVMAQSANDAIISIDENSIILFANVSTERIFGYEHDELVGEPLTKLMPDYLRHLHKAAIERYIETGEKHLHWGGVELPGLHSNGSEIPLELSFGETEENGRRIFTGVIRDVSERKRVERRWEAQYAIARILAGGDDLEQATSQILETICKCLDWQVGIFWRPEAGGALRASRSWFDPDLDVEGFIDASWKTALPKGVGVPGRVRSSREPLWLPDVEEADNYPRQAYANAAGLHAAFAFPIITQGELVGVMEFYSSEIREPDMTLMTLVKSTAVQIGQFVERRRAQVELVELNRELEKRVRERTSQLQGSTDELESFVYSVSHDLRAPLRGIDGFSQLLIEDFGADLGEEARGYLLRIQSAAGRMGDLIDDLLNLSRISKSDLKIEPVDLSEIASLIVRELRRREPDRHVDVQLAPGLIAEGDPQLLRLVLENLLGNSWKFTSRTERPRIELAAHPEDRGKVFFIRDNGAGFDAAYADKLFKPFQRLHSPNEFEGTGIGLTTVQRIIQKHAGRIWVEAEVDRGATFYFTLGEGGTSTEA